MPTLTGLKSAPNFKIYELYSFFIVMKKLNRKSFALILNDLDTMEKLNILLVLFDDLSEGCKEKTDYQPLKDF
jgi:hypothetical protein